MQNKQQELCVGSVVYSCASKHERIELLDGAVLTGDSGGTYDQRPGNTLYGPRTGLD